MFAMSYFCKYPQGLRRVQALAAVLWIAYGLLIDAPPVVVANLVVAAVAVYSSLGRSGDAPTRSGEQDERAQ